MPELNILVSSKGTSESKLESGQPNGGVSATSNVIEGHGTKSMFQSVAMHNLISSTVNLAKNMIADSVSMYGDMTGKYREQSEIENIFKVTSGVTSFGTGLAAGAAVGGVPGLVVAAVVKTGNLVYQQVKSNIAYSNSIVKSNIAANFNSQRIGNILIGGGRE